jgi:hypothetical protein
MTKRNAWMILIALSFLVSGMTAMAADAPAAATAPAAKPAPVAAPAAPAAVAAPAAKPAAAPTAATATAPAAKKDAAASGKNAGEAVTVTGKLTSRMVMNKKAGKEVKGFFVTAKEAKKADGTAIATLAGKEIRVGGKEATLTPFVDKDVTIAGKLSANMKHVRVETIK